jgi:hypothetical protein
MSPASGFKWAYAPGSSCFHHANFHSGRVSGLTLVLTFIHQGEIPPEVLKTIRTAEERGEVRRVHEDDIAGSLLIVLISAFFGGACVFFPVT